MADKTPTYDLAGILVPRKFSATLASDYASGTDYTEADRRPGAVTYSGATAARLVLEATGEIDATATTAPTVKFTRGGMPTLDGASYVYRYGASGDWYGSDPTYALTGYTVIAAGTSSRTYGQTRSVVLSDGTIVVVAVKAYTASPYFTLQSHVRSPAGVWTTYTIQEQTSSTGSTEVALCLAPDGALHVYWPQVTSGSAMTLSLYRSEDGETWYRQGDSVNGIGTFTAITHLAAATISGSVVLFKGDTSSQQYVSSDAGYTFETVGSAENHRHVADLRVSEGFCHALVQATTGSEHCYHRRIASGGQNLWDQTATDLGANDKDNAAFLAATPFGLLAYFVDSNGEMWSSPYRSINAGADWAIYYGHGDNTPSAIVGHCSALWHRGRLHVFGSPTTVSTGASISAGALVDMTLSGHSVVPLYGAGLSTIESAASITAAWVPVELLNLSGWTATDVNIVSRSLLDQYELVTVGGSSSAQSSFTASGVGDYESHCIVSVEVTAGVLEIVLAGQPRSVSVFVTATQIDIVETGVTPVYTNHGITGPIEIRIACDGAAEKARGWYRASTDSDERAWQSMGSAISLSTVTTGNELTFKVQADSTARFYFAGWRYAFQPPNSGIAEMDTSAGTSIMACPILATRRSFLGSGIYLRGRGGPARYDATTYAVSLGGGRYTKANLLPALSPSPRALWRSSGTTAQTLKFTVEPETEGETEWLSGVVGFYLDGLVNVPNVNLKNAGVSIGSVDLRTSFTYTHDTGAIYPAATGSTVDGEYIAEGSLVGCQFEFANGQIRTIADNTEGVLTSGSSVDQKRCRIRVEGLDGTEDASGTGYIWPKRALIIQYLRGTREVTQVQIEIPATAGADSKGYREIGTVAIGEISVLGRAFDRTSSDEITAGVETFQATDGSSVVSVRGPTYRTLELAFVESPTFMGQIRSGGSPDYVTASASASALPAATLLGIPMTIEGIYRRTEGASLPVVPIRRIPRDSGSGSALYVATIGKGAIADGAMLARITGSIRREQIQVGQAFVDDAERVATVTFREIV